MTICLSLPKLATAGEVTLEDLHELLLRQQKIIEEQGRKIESLQRELDEVKGAPTASGAQPNAPASAVTAPAQGTTPASVGSPVPIGAPAPTGAPAPLGVPSADADAAATPTTAPSGDATMKRIDRITKLLERFSINSYGVVTYSNYDWQTDEDKRDDVDFEHATFEVVYHATDTVKLEAEVEIEHLGTGSTMEFDKFEEFGEFETEVERGGEVELEELVLEYEPWRWLGVKAGYFPIPIGLNNERHRPQQYFTTTRFESEVALIPSVWTEAGVEVFGKLDVPNIGDVDLGDVRYKLAGVNGLDSTGFSSANWVKNGHQTRFEKMNAEDWAVVARLDYYPIRGAFVGASTYYGDSSDNRPKPDLDVDADVTIWDVHGEYKRGLLEARGLYMRGHLENSAAVSGREPGHLAVHGPSAPRHGRRSCRRTARVRSQRARMAHAAALGVGLTNVVNGHLFLLHDGRARGFIEAIMWHGGEAEAACETVRRMSEGNRAALVRFLESL